MLTNQTGMVKTMYADRELCEKITSLYPDVGTCGVDIDVTYDEKQQTWLVHLEKDSHKLDHYLEMTDADQCMDGKQCVSLGLEIAQLKKNIMGDGF